jgi:catechol 2,3-dioxygenase-like lactoylglutathione lyase family enzyme
MPKTLFTGINHICVATNDIERAVRLWWQKYGVGPWALYSYDASNMSAIVDGRPTDFRMRVALCGLSATFRIELIQPLDDRSPYAKSLAEHHGADHIHHVRLEVDDYEGVRGQLLAHGLPALLEAGFSGAPGSDARFVGSYHATGADLGFVVEIARAEPKFAMPEPELVYPPAHAT